MKLVTAIIRSSLLIEVRAALEQAGVPGMTVSDVRGYGRQRGRADMYGDTEHAVDFVAKTRVDVVVDDADADEVIDVIVAAARTGKIGDGKVWATPVSTVVRIRTGERGTEAV